MVCKRLLQTAAVAALLGGGSVTASAQLLPELGGQRAGISSLQFLKLGPNPRAAALGESFVALVDDASSLYWNPAGATQFSGNEVMLSHMAYVADIRHEFAAGVYHLSPSMAVGLSLTALTTDRIAVTTEFEQDGTGRTFGFGDIAVGLTFSQRMTDQFSYGVTVRYAEEQAAELKQRAGLVDLGIAYKTGWRGSRFAVAITNFGGQINPTGNVTRQSQTGPVEVTGFQDFQAPTLFRIGFALDAWQRAEQRLTVTTQLNHPNDNAENLAFGAEYNWNNILALRTGYRLNVDEVDAPSVGVGLNLPTVGRLSVGADYALTHLDRLGTIHQLGVRLRF